MSAVEPNASDPSHGALTAMPRTALSALAEGNPRYLTAAQRRLLHGLYPEPSTSVFSRERDEREIAALPRLRTLPELSAAEHAHALALARAGASVNGLVRGFCLTRWAALTIHREGRPAVERAPAPAPDAPVASAPPMPAQQPAPALALAPEPAPAPAPEALTPEQRVAALAEQFGKAFPRG